jgi:hypothetical protein
MNTGQTLNFGNTNTGIYGDTTNLALRAAGSVFVQNPNGNPANVMTNDVFLASRGQWASQIGGSSHSISLEWSVNLGVGQVATMSPYNYSGAGGLTLTGVLRANGGSNCEGSMYVQWRDSAGNVQRGYTLLGGANMGNGNDGGSGMTYASTWTIPLFPGTYFVDFMGQGCRGAQVEAYGMSVPN